MARSTKSAVWAVIALTTAMLLTLPAPVGAIDPAPVAGAPAQPGPVKAGRSTVVGAAPALLAAPTAPAGRRDVFIALTGPGAAADFSAVLSRTGSVEQARAAAQRRRSAVATAAAGVLRMVRILDPGAAVLFQVGNAVPGLAVSALPVALAAVDGRGDVQRISALIPKSPAGPVTAPAEAPAATAAVLAADPLPAQPSAALRAGGGPPSSGPTAEPAAQVIPALPRVPRIGIIDTGIDYTHADFGGSGTPAAAAQARAAADWQPTSTVVGGRDFVGDDYNPAPTRTDGAANAGYQPVPRPDPNPMDCLGHGTAVASAAAGSGIDAAGALFRARTADVDGLLDARVAPGAAPAAQLYALKVFGCSDTTEAVIPALDWALDPNGDGDFSDRLDVVDLSLTVATTTLEPPSAADDPDTVVLDAVAALGILPVVAAGNGGDTTGAMTAPGTATRAVTVGESIGSFRRLDGLDTSTGGTRAVVAGQASVAYPWGTAADVSGPVVALSSANADGCAPLSAADAAAVKGSVVWLNWDDGATQDCGSVARSAGVRAAGAVGVLLTSSAPLFGAAITGDPQIPVFQLTPAATTALQDSVGHGLTVTFRGALLQSQSFADPSVVDLLADRSARGGDGTAGRLGPDLVAPAGTGPVARAGTGTQGEVPSGTSIAAARVAGLAGLVMVAHPDWTVEQVKAALMNRAGHDVYTGPDRTGLAYGPARVGAGRVDGPAAAAATVLAFSTTTPGAVAVSFGAVEADVSLPAPDWTQSLTVQNTGTTTATLTLSYQALVLQPGVSISVTPAAMTLAPGASALATVTLSVRPAELRRSMDPTMAAQQTNVLTGLDEPRQFLADASGRILVQDTDGGIGRVPVSAAVRPVSTTHAVAGTVGGQPAIVLQGQGFDQKSDSDPEATRYRSLVSVLQLGELRTPCVPVAAASGCPAAPAGAIGAVGAGRSGPDGDDAVGRLWFGVSLAAATSAFGAGLLPTVAIDTTADGRPDFTVQVRQVGGRSDLLYAYLYRGTGSAARLLSIAPVNFNTGNVDTGVFDTSVVLIPVDPADLGLRLGTRSFPLAYQVQIVSTASPADPAAAATGVADRTGWIPFDPAAPGVLTASPVWSDQGDTGIGYQVAAGTGSVRTLVLHLHGAAGQRQEVLTVPGAGG